MAHEGAKKILLKAHLVVMGPSQWQRGQHVVWDAKFKTGATLKLQLPFYGQRHIGTWDTIFLDYIKGFSEWVEALSIRNKIGNPTARLLHHPQVFCHCSAPFQISTGSTSFVTQLFEVFAPQLGIRKFLSPTPTCMGRLFANHSRSQLEAPSPAGYSPYEILFGFPRTLVFTVKPGDDALIRSP